MRTVRGAQATFGQKFRLVRGLGAHVFVFDLVDFLVGIADGGILPGVDRPGERIASQVRALRFNLLLKHQLALHLGFLIVKCFLHPGAARCGQSLPRLIQLARRFIRPAAGGLRPVRHHATLARRRGLILRKLQAGLMWALCAVIGSAGIFPQRCAALLRVSICGRTILPPGARLLSAAIAVRLAQAAVPGKAQGRIAALCGRNRVVCATMRRRRGVSPAAIYMLIVILRALVRLFRPGVCISHAGVVA
ncbi:hypothetical protein LJC56_08560 [Christensenellaceae bacterium OttesenSCG-928-K19]|nr:hypothetical protein [Christensenellaceae bacterium OttesenSCG-928-K19]